MGVMAAMVAEVARVMVHSTDGTTTARPQWGRRAHQMGRHLQTGLHHLTTTRIHISTTKALLRKRGGTAGLLPRKADEVKLLPFPEGSHWRAWRASTIRTMWLKTGS